MVSEKGSWTAVLPLDAPEPRGSRSSTTSSTTDESMVKRFRPRAGPHRPNCTNLQGLVPAQDDASSRMCPDLKTDVVGVVFGRVVMCVGEFDVEFFAS